ncbi:T9SS type A sorting domain-containing protein [Flavobacterium sp. AS60]|uniref:DUF7619 domain-containing protein n=1 Tax=Flavobacterium anseongense TaxID=2910677 RepID=UPI001F2B4BB2|nr:T9SS type A sorting domain-containing protein [Flavobacterium sp. AS60]MCF6129514.1 T9SS type A sorting domain-containing protein [Flavobacterium sp. AS60]
MKKLYFFLLLTINVFISNAQIVTIPDINFKTKLLAASTTNQIGKDLAGNYIKIDANNNGEIEVSEAQQIAWLDVNNQNAAASVLISNVTGIENFTNLVRLNVAYNSLAAINLAPFTNLQAFFCQSNQITSLDFTGLTNVTGITAWQNQLTSVNVNGLVNLTTAWFDTNQLTTLDFSSCINLNNVYCASNQLVWLNLKNGKNEANTGFGSNPTLRYICADEGQLNSIQNLLDVFSMTNCNIGTYCSFTPGGNYYTIQGNSKFDSNNNGCDLLDISYPYLKLNFSGVTTGSMFANTSGNYSIPVSAGTHTITPVLENPSYFIVSPTSTVVNFPTQSSPYTQDFCISANGIHNDVESWIFPLTRARPGFDARYKIVYKNKGNQTMSGTLTFGFDDDYMDFVSATPTPESINFSLLTWNYVNLLPFEIREIEVTLNMNTPSESLPLNIGSIIKFESTIFPLAGDETQTDNSHRLQQVVVGSFDPNDKNCLEGNVVGVEKVGDYVHYMIRFENTGTAAAENVVVKDIIDTAKFDIATLVALSASHSFLTKITYTNRVEFIFENINLPFDDANNDGYVVFKIKTKSTLVVGNTFSNSASIYFDYNFPIVTNTATTTIAALGTQDFEFSNMFTLSPVPAKNSLTITTKQNVTISSVSIYNELGQLIQVTTNPNDTIDVSGLKAGIYFIKILSDKGTSTDKFIKANY